jgi:glycosyltransferase involved in cell wall biosynthesis
LLKAYIEAMATGRPAVANPVRGVTDAVRRRVTSLLVPVDGPAPPVDALRMLDANPFLRTRLEEAGGEGSRMKLNAEIVIENLPAFCEKHVDFSLAVASERADG